MGKKKIIDKKKEEIEEVLDDLLRTIGLAERLIIKYKVKKEELMDSKKK